MATFALIPGAGDVPWSWSFVAAELRERGHEAVAVDLPCEDASAGWSEYADAVVDAVGDADELVVVAHSLGGFTAPLVCERVAVDVLVLVCGMIPAPGEKAGEWWANNGYPATAAEGDEIALYMHDVAPELAAEALARARDQSETPMLEPWPLERWPDVPTRYLLCRDDRVHPADWVRGVVRERLGITPDEMPGSHAPYLAHPQDLAARLEEYRLGGRGLQSSALTRP